MLVAKVEAKEWPKRTLSCGGAQVEQAHLRESGWSWKKGGDLKQQQQFRQQVQNQQGWASLAATAERRPASLPQALVVRSVLVVSSRPGSLVQSLGSAW